MGKMYIGVSGAAQNVKKMYIGVGGVAKAVKKAYIGVGGVAKLIYSGEKADISYVGKSSSMAYGGSSMSVSIPSGYAENDLLLLVVHSNVDSDLDVPDGWTIVSQLSVSSKRSGVMYKIAGSSESAVSVALSGTFNGSQGMIFAFRNVDTTTPINAYKSKVHNTGSNLTTDTVTTTQDKCMIAVCVGVNKDYSGTDNFTDWANANLESITEAHDQTITTLDGGGVALAYGRLLTAGATGSTTATCSTFSKASFVVALNPAE